MRDNYNLKYIVYSISIIYYFNNLANKLVVYNVHIINRMKNQIIWLYINTLSNYLQKLVLKYLNNE